MTPKQRAAETAVGYLRSGMVIGLGTGSTADCFLQALSASIKGGALTGIRGVPTSEQSERRARALGIPLVGPGQCAIADITVDGADEVDPHLNLIKGLGGALLREKMVAQNSRQLIIIADSSKLVPSLGTKAALPVEVVPFAHELHVSFLRSLGCEPILRRSGAGIYATDNGNYIYDCRFPRIDDPAALLHALSYRAGVIACGLFLDMAHLALIGTDSGVDRLERRR